jgi:oligopeptidase B
VALLAGCAEAAPPLAKVVPAEVMLGSKKVVDDYWWLRDKSNPAVIEYLNAENAYTDAAMKPTEALQKKLYDEMSDRLPDESETVPYRAGDWWYSTRHGLDYPVFLRRRGSPKADPEVIADVNKLAEGHKFFEYNEGAVSDDGNLLAFSTDTTGGRKYLMQVKDLRNGELLADVINMVDSFDWAADNKTIYYTKQNDAKRPDRLYRHVLGTAADADALVYEEKDEQFVLQVNRTRDKKYLLLVIDSTTSSEVRVLDAARAAPPLLIEPRKPDQKYTVDHRGNRFYLRVNDTGPNFRIVSAPDSDPGSKHWSELVAVRNDVVLEDHDVFAHHLVLSERRNGISQIAVARLPDGDADPAEAGKLAPKELAFAEPDYSVAVTENFEFDSPALRFSYTSLTTPLCTFDLNLATGQRVLLKKDHIGGGFDPANYREERVFATARDGAKIPISLVYRLTQAAPGAPATRPAGPHAMLLYGYGSYGTSVDPDFQPTRLSLLDRGMIYGIAHVRGGGEFGRAWYDAGRMQNKPNTFSDFIACAEYLEKNGYTAPDKLAIQGASAGGLLIGAVVNQRPDLFKAAIAEVPWVDVLADMSDRSVPLTTLEYKEWGDPSDPGQRALIASYDPYSNVRPQAYPAMLVRESINDSQVQYWDAARWVAKLRAAKKQAGAAGSAELLLKMDMDAGHSGPSGLDSEIHDDAFNDAWLLTRLGMEKTP